MRPLYPLYKIRGAFDQPQSLFSKAFSTHRGYLVESFSLFLGHQPSVTFDLRDSNLISEFQVRFEPRQTNPAKGPNPN